MNRQTRPTSRGFTLVELLVVIAIIGVLAAIITPAVFRSMVRAREARIFMEINQLHMAVESYRQKHGDYPPDFTDGDIVSRHLRKAFPRHVETDTGALSELLSLNLTAAEALVFFLAQVGNDPRRPLSGRAHTDRDPDSPPSGWEGSLDDWQNQLAHLESFREQFFDFEESRLRPTRRIRLGDRLLNLYAYVPQDAQGAPYIYFENRTYASARYDAVHPVSETVRPYQSSQTTIPDFANSTTFQIISAGLDGEFGDTGAEYKIFPAGTNYTREDLDNITNFSDGRTLGDHLE